MVEWLVAALLIAFMGGVLPFLPFFSRPEKSLWPRLGIGIASFVLMMVASSVLLKKSPLFASLAWQIPNAAFGIGIDFGGAMILFFMSITALMCVFLGDFEAKASKMTWFWFNSLFAVFVLIVISRNGFLFILGWELTTIIVFLLLASCESTAAPTGKSGFYLVINYVGGLFLIFLFAILGQDAKLLEFTELNGAKGELQTLCALLAIAAFSLKGGLFPFHGWVSSCLSKVPVFIGAFLTGCLGNLAFYSLFQTLNLMDGIDDLALILLMIFGFVTAISILPLALTRLDHKSMAAEFALSETGIAFMVFGALLFLNHQGGQHTAFLPYLFFFSSLAILRQSFFFVLVKDSAANEGFPPGIVFQYLFPAIVLWSFLGFFELSFFYQHWNLAIGIFLFLALILNRSFLMLVFARLLLQGELKKPWAIFSVMALVLNVAGIAFPWVERWLKDLFLVSSAADGFDFGVVTAFSTILILFFLFFLEESVKKSPKNVLEPSSHLMRPFVFSYILTFLKRSEGVTWNKTQVKRDYLVQLSRFITQPLLFIENATMPLLLLYYMLLAILGLLCVMML